MPNAGWQGLPGIIFEIIFVWLKKLENWPRHALEVGRRDYPAMLYFDPFLTINPSFFNPFRILSSRSGSSWIA